MKNLLKTIYYMNKKLMNFKKKLIKQKKTIKLKLIKIFKKLKFHFFQFIYLKRFCNHKSQDYKEK